MPTVCICGAGNSAHVLIAQMGSLPDVTVNVFAPFQDEAERLTAAHAKWGGITVENPDGSKTVGKANKISKNPEEVVPTADIVLIPLPSFAHDPTLEAIAPHLQATCTVGAMPGQGGFQWKAKAILRKLDHTKGVTLFGTNMLPYNCRIIEWGHCVRLFGEKAVGIATVPHEKVLEVVSTISAILPRLTFKALDHFLCATLHPANQCIHPSRMYSLVHEHKVQDGGDPNVWPENPLFYESMDAFSADTMASVDGEIQAIKRGVEVASKETINVPTLNQGILGAYSDQITDKSSLLTCITTNAGFAGIHTPMVPVEGGFAIDYRGRYFVEDIPGGMCTLKGIAVLADVPTPVIDKIIVWAQARMGREYLVDGKLAGKDIGECYTPQRYGFDSVPALVE